MSATSQTGTEHRIEITRFLAAPPEVVWRAWTEPDALRRWFCPKDFRVHHAEADVRAGGAWRSEMRSPEGEAYIHRGVYRRVERPRRLVLTHAWEREADPAVETVITLTLTPAEGGTRLVFEQTGFASAASGDSHAEGWNEAIDNLVGHVTGEDDRELVVSRVFDVPPDRLWRAWTDPAQLTRWWGPEGFSTTTHEIDLRPGGVWRFTMHGPDGRDYPNRVEFDEVLEARRLRYRHTPVDGVEPVCFDMLMTFEPLDDGRRTGLVLRMAFPTSAERERVGREYGAFEGALQTVGRLAAWTREEDSPPRPIVALPSAREIVVRREFDTPRERVFQAFTKSDHLRRWWGCGAVPMVGCEIDFRAGGRWRFVHRGLDGTELATEGDYLEIVPLERIVLSHHDVDDGSRETIAVEVFQFEERDGRTILTDTLRLPSRETRDAYLELGLEDRAGESFDRLEAWLADEDEGSDVAGAGAPA